MKYSVSITEEYAKKMDQFIGEHMNDKIINPNFGSGEVMMVAKSALTTGNKVYLLLMEGNIFNYIKAKMQTTRAKVDCIFIGWPKKLRDERGVYL